MQTVLTRYFDLLKDSMKSYVNYLDLYNHDTSVIASKMVNSPIMGELYVL
jgi:hypothetical protein